ncbi:MAG: hypothetical protein COA42_17525, partial [Alteromonadaceae bacterium]
MSKPEIEHVVLLMLENRSFDDLLGWLYEEESPELNIPPLKNGERAYEGLQGLDLAAFTNTAGKLSQAPVHGVSGLTIPSIAPGEHFNQVQQQLFNTETPSADKPASMNGYLADYVDVLKASSDWNKDNDVDFYGPKIMETYSRHQVGVLNDLARHYAVCDHWFSSVPSQTNPNRAFSMTGTSQGLADNGYLETDPRAEVIEDGLKMGLGDDRFQHKTLFNALEEGGESSWKIFWETALVPEKISKVLDLIGNKTLDDVLDNIKSSVEWAEIISKIFLDDTNEFIEMLEKLQEILPKIAPAAAYLQELTSGKLDSCYTYRLFPAIKNDVENAESHFDKIEEFHNLARAGQLPKFSFIEPFWTISESAVDRGAYRLFTEMGNDYHAPANQDVGEEYVKSIYKSLIANPEAWQKTLFIITFDEPVGAFDHVSPGKAVPPWGVNGKPGFKPPIGFDGKPKPLLQHGFQFDRFGGRVPAIIASPLVQKGTVFRTTTDTPYDHTSLIKTILKVLGHEDKVSDFGERVKHAPTFDNVLTLDKGRNDEADLPFLNIARENGTVLNYYDRFSLRHENGEFITQSEMENKYPFPPLPDLVAQFELDLGLKAQFPTAGTGSPAIFYLQKSQDRPAKGNVQAEDVVKLIATETALNANVVLGAWSDSYDCYYSNDYLLDENNKKQEWQVEAAS